MSGANSYEKNLQNSVMAATVVGQNQGRLLLMISLDYLVCHMPPCRGYSNARNLSIPSIGTPIADCNAKF